MRLKIMIASMSVIWCLNDLALAAGVQLVVSGFEKTRAINKVYCSKI